MKNKDLCLYGDRLEALAQARVEGLTKRKTPRGFDKNIMDIEEDVVDNFSDFYPPLKGISEEDSRRKISQIVYLPTDNIKK